MGAIKPQLSLALKGEFAKRGLNIRSISKKFGIKEASVFYWFRKNRFPANVLLGLSRQVGFSQSIRELQEKFDFVIISSRDGVYNELEHSGESEFADKNLVSLVKVVAQSNCDVVTFEDLKRLVTVQDALGQELTPRVVEELIKIGHNEK